MGLGDGAGIGFRHELVFAAVYEQQRPWRQLPRVFGRPQLSQADGPLVDRDGKIAIADDAHEPGVLDEALRVAGPVVEVSRCPQGGHPPYPQVTGAGADADRTAGAKTGEPDAVGPLIAVEVLGGGEDVVEPPVEREVALRAAGTPRIEGQRHPTHLLRDAVGQRGVRRGGRCAPISARGISGYEYDAWEPGTGASG